MFKSRTKQLKRQKKLMLEGELTIQYAEKLKDVLLQSISNTPLLSINMDKVTAMDLTALQLFCSLLKTEREDMQITIEGEWPPAFKEIASSSAYSECSDCFIYQNQQVLCLKGDHE